MKKFQTVLLGLVAVVCFLSFHIKSKAQCPTPPDCPNDPFIPGTPYVEVLSPTCTVTVNWCWRIACGTWNDLVITSIRLDGDCTDILPYLSFYQDQAIEAIFLQNPWGAAIPPCPAQSSAFWRLGKIGCGIFILVQQDIMTLQPCEPVSRCWERVTVCYRTSPINGLPYDVSTTNVGTPFPSIPCSQTSPPPANGGIYYGTCQNICEP